MSLPRLRLQPDTPLGSALLGLALALGLSLALLGLRAGGALQGLELQGYDLLHGLQKLSGGPKLSPQAALPITMVWLTDEDEAEFGAPLPDRVLSEVLERLRGAGASTIGLDLYRDTPIPDRDGHSGRAELDAALLAHPGLFVVYKFGGVPPPAVLADGPQIGFADFLYDDGGFLRRGLLFLDDGEQFGASLAFQLATRWLAGLGIHPQPGIDNPEHLRLGQAEFAPLEPPFGPYQIFDARGYQYLLGFPLPDHDVESYRIGELLHNPLASDALHGRLVLIGSRTETGKDYFFTPYSRWQSGDQRVFGALAHALAVRQLVAQAQGELPLFWQAPALTEALGILLCCGLGAWLGWRIQAPWQFALLLGGAVAVGLGAALVALRAGLLLAWVPAVLGYSAALMLAATESLRRARLARAQWAALFARRTSPALAAHCWARRSELLQDGRMRPQSLYASVLFTDLRGFSSISEPLDPETLMRWLNAYMEAMVSEVFAHGGFVDKLIGDAVMAVFGVPLAAEDEAGRAANARAAVACACAMAARLEKFNAEWAGHGFAPAAMRIGIASGPLVAGTLGSSERQEYTVLGDTVNTASRLESYDKDYAADDPCRILINDATATLLDPTAQTLEPVGKLALKGKQESVQVLRVLHAP